MTKTRLTRRLCCHSGRPKSVSPPQTSMSRLITSYSVRSPFGSLTSHYRDIYGIKTSDENIR